MKKNNFWKVIGRSIVCNNFCDWVHETVYCYFVLKYFKRELNDFLVAGHEHKFTEDLFGNYLNECTKKNRDSFKRLGIYDIYKNGEYYNRFGECWTEIK